MCYGLWFNVLNMSLSINQFLGTTVLDVDAGVHSVTDNVKVMFALCTVAYRK